MANKQNTDDSAEIITELKERLFENLERDFSDCKDFQKRFESIRGYPNTPLEKTVAAIHSRMRSFEGLTAEQLWALSTLDEPLSSVYRCFVGIVQGDPRNTDEIDTAILGTAKAQYQIMLHLEAAEQEQDSELER